MPHLVNHQQFQVRSQTTPRTFVITGTGVAELQAKLGGKDDPDAWVTAENASGDAFLFAPVVYAFELSVNQIYRFEITGDSTAWLADPNIKLLS